jgi:uncharacterized protein YceH (UPF0502 family)
METPSAEEPASPKWQPLEAIQRRVLGVLIEKAKTTPDNYPLSLNALRSGCNQKNNRAPLMQLEEPQIEEALDELRKVGAVALVQGDSRIDRYRHLAYQWLGVEKVELAVMAELLLRGAQTVGELRGRAARMEPIKDLGELMPTLDSLAAKKLVMHLTPPGRGCVVTHALYLDRELEKVRREAGTLQSAALAEPTEPAGSAPRPPRPAAAPSPPVDSTLASQLHQLREDITELKRDLAAARADFQSTAQTLRRDLDELNRQLGN